MITRRIIPCLLISGKKLIKTVKFSNPKYVGDPINAVKIFNDKEVDEIIILDIDATEKKAGPQFEFLQEVITESFVPLSYGGGVKDLQQIDKLLLMGIEKVCINSANQQGLELITSAAEKHGAQSIVGVIDVKQTFFGKKKVYFKNTKTSLDESIESYAKRLQAAGAGEILLNFVDKDGSYEGYDFEMIEKISSKLEVPLVVLGGASNEQDFSKAFSLGASAVCAGSLFVFHGPHRAVLINYPERKTVEKIIFQRN